MINFVNKGTDEAILKSLPTENCDEDLVKAMNKQGMVQKEVQVRGKNGTFTRKQWVRASEAAASDGGSKSTNKADDGGKVGRMTGLKETKNADGKDVLEFTFNGEKHQAEKGKTFTMTVKTSQGTESKISGPLKFGDGGYARVGSYPLAGMDNIVSINSKTQVGGDTKAAKTKARKVNSVDDFSLGAKAINRRLAKELNIHNSIGVVPNSVAGNGVGTVTVVAYVGKLSHQCKNFSEMEKFVKDQLTKEFGKDFVSKVKTREHGDMEFVLNIDGNGGGNNGGGKSTASSSDDGDGGDKKTSRKQWVNPKSAQEAKSQIKSMIDSGMSREDCMSELKSAGVTWKHSDHAGINWMRAMQAAQKPVAADTSDDDEEDTINSGYLPKDKVQSIVHSYIGGLTVQEDVDVDDIIDHIRENYTNNYPLDDETYTAVEDAVKELTDRAKNGID